MTSLLDAHKGNLKDSLIKNFKEGRDYKIEKVPKTKRVEIYLSLDCLKRFVMQSRAKNAEQVRSYFIAMEDMYRQHMIEGIEDRLYAEEEEITERKRKTKPATDYKKGHCVYIIEIDLGQDKKLRYKVGRTKDLNRRVSEHWAKLPGFSKVIYVKYMPAHRFGEICLHEAIGKLKCEGEQEIFEGKPDKIIKLLEYCAKMREDLHFFSEI